MEQKRNNKFIRAVYKNRKILTLFSLIIVALITTFFVFQSGYAYDKELKTTRGLSTSGLHKATTYCDSLSDLSNRIIKIGNSGNKLYYTGTSGSYKYSGRTYHTFGSNGKKGSQTFSGKYMEMENGVHYNGKTYDLVVRLNGKYATAAGETIQSFEPSNYLQVGADVGPNNNHVEIHTTVEIHKHKAGKGFGDKVAIPDLMVAIYDIDVLQSYKVPRSTSNNCWYDTSSKSNLNSAKVYVSNKAIYSLADKKINGEPSTLYTKIGSNGAKTSTFKLIFGFEHKPESASQIMLYIWKYKATFKSDSNGKIYEDSAHKKSVSSRTRWRPSGLTLDNSTYHGANTGYKTTGWTADRDVVISGKTYKKGTLLTNDQIKKVVMTSDVVFTVHHEPNEYTVTYKSDSNGKVTGTTSEKVKYNNSPKANVTDTANTGYKTTNKWTCVDSDKKAVLTNKTIAEIRKLKITKSLTCTVVHEKKLNTVTYKSADANGKVTGTTSEQVLTGNSPKANVTDTANTGYKTTNKWTCKMGSTTYSDKTLAQIKTIKVNNDMTCTIPHVEDRITVTYKSDQHGSITGIANETILRGGNPAGSTQSPNSGYKLSYWQNDVAITIDNEVIPRNSKLTMAQIKTAVITQNTTFTAYHSPLGYTITYKTDEGGNIVDPNTDDYRVDVKNYGEKAGPGAQLETKEGYVFKSWTCKDDAGNIETGLNNVQMSVINEWTVTHNLTCTAYHEKNNYTVIYKSDSGGAITGQTSENVEYGKNPTGTEEQPNTGFNTVGWKCNKNVTLNDGSSIEANTLMTYEKMLTIFVNSNITCIVTHNNNKYTVKYKSDDYGTINNVLGKASGTDTESVSYKETPSGASESANEGYKYDKWTCDKNVTLKNGDLISAGDPLTLDQIKQVEVTENLEFTVHHIKEIKVTLNKYENLEDGTHTTNTLQNAEFELYEGAGSGSCSNNSYSTNRTCTEHGVCKYKVEKDGRNCEVVIENETAQGCEEEVEAEYGKEMIYTPYIWNIDSTDRLIGTYKTDSNGQIELTKILDQNGRETNFKEGARYYFIEKKAPTSYTLSSDLITFAGGTTDIDLKAYNDRKLGKVKLKKTDENGRPLENAIFDLYKRGVSNSRTVEYSRSNIDFSYNSSGITLLDSNRSFSKDNLGLLNTSFTSSNMNTILDMATTKAVNTYLQSYLNGTYGNNLGGYVIEDLSEDLMGIILINNITGNASSGSGEAYLYSIKKDSAYSNTFGKIGTYTTNANGIIEVDSLTWTDYYFRETSAPDGYITKDGNERINFTVNSSNAEDVQSFIVENKEQAGKVTFIKKSEDNDVIPGAKFDLYKNDGTLVRTDLVTDGNGKIEVNDLNWGTYYFEETEAPDGYGLSNEKIVFTINKNNYSEDQQIIMNNEPTEIKPYVKVIKKIKKSDIVYDHGIATFIFKLTGTDVNNKEHTYYKTVSFAQAVVDEQEGDYVKLNVLFKELEKGVYTLSEEEVNRYQLESIDSTGTVQADKTIFDLTSSVSGTATFTDKKIDQSGLTDTEVKTNIFTKR